MKIIHRVLELITNQNLNNSKFEKMNSISNGYLSKQLKNEGDIGEDKQIIIDLLQEKIKHLEQKLKSHKNESK